MITASSSAVVPLHADISASTISTEPRAAWNPKWAPAARQALLKNGYEPIPLVGKRPVLDQWQNARPTAEDIATWERTHPNATNTGILTRLTPAVDDDVLDQEVADIIHGWVKELISPSCPELLRIGRFPKRAILFRCEAPFPKVSTGKWLDSNNGEHQLEILCDGQQIAVYGEHPDTHQPYTWPGSRPARTPRILLPLLTAEAAQALVGRAKALFRERGWRPKHEERPPRPNQHSDGEAHKIAIALGERIESLCRELLPGGRIDGRNWAVGDINGQPGSSLKVCLVGDHRGLWLDFADEGWRGDALDLVEAVKNLRTVDAMDWARSWLGWLQREQSRRAQEPPHHFSQSTSPDSVELVMRRGSEIKMEPVRWLWDQRIATGKLCLIAGEPGLAKSQVTLWLGAAVTTRGALPGGGVAPQGSVVILSAEDTPEDTIIPRLKAVDANLDRISIISMVRETKAGISAQRSFDLQLDLPALERAVAKLSDVQLIVIDPIASYMGKRVDSHKNAEVRAVLEPVATFAAKHKITVLGVTHFSKGAGPTAINKFIGSIAFIAAARSAFVVTMDPDSTAEGRRLFLPVKNNLAKLGHGLAFQVEQALIEDDDGTAILASRVHWLDETIDRHANAVLAALAEGHDSALSKAEGFLREILAGGRRRMTEIRQAARGHGHAWRTVERAKHKLGIVSINEPEPSTEGTPPKPCWFWEMPQSEAERSA